LNSAPDLIVLNINPKRLWEESGKARKSVG